MQSVSLPQRLDDVLPADAVAVLISLRGTHGATTADWMNAWHGEVLRFHQEMDVPPEAWGDMTRHRHDWVGALQGRVNLARCLADHDDRVPPAALDWLARVDDFMRSFTEDDRSGWHEDAQPEGAWWWYRLPLHGPVRAGWWAQPDVG